MKSHIVLGSHLGFDPFTIRVLKEKRKKNYQEKKSRKVQYLLGGLHDAIVFVMATTSTGWARND